MHIFGISDTFIIILILLIPIFVLALVIYVIVTLLRNKNKGEIDFHGNYLNILENDTEVELNKEEENKKE